MRTAALFLSLMLLLTVPIIAQDDYPLPDDLQPITPDNAAQLQELASIGGILPGRLVWSPDGAILAVGTSVDARLYNASDFEAPPLVIPDYGETTFNADGELVVSGQRWDVQTGELLGADEPPPAPPVLSPSGNIEVRVSGQDGQPVVELHKTGGDITLLRPGSDYDFNQIVFSPDELYAALVLTFYPDGYPSLAVQLWNIKEGTLVADLPQSLEILDTIAFHADGKLLVTAVTTDALYGGPFEDVQIWDGRTGENVGPRIYGSLPVRFSPDGSLLAFMSSEGITLWTDHEIGVLEFDPFSEGERTPIVFSPDGSTIATVSGREILLWAINAESAPDSPRQTLPAEAGISSLLYSPDGSLLVSIESNGIIEVWDAQTNALHTRLSADDYAYDVQFSPDGRLLRAYEYGGHRLIWDVDTGDNSRLTLPFGAVLNADWSQAAYWDNNIVRIADTDTGQETELTVIQNYLGTVAAFSPVTDRVIFTGAELRMYDLRSGELVFSETIGERLPWVVFNANGERFMTGLSPVVYGRGDPLVLNIRETQNPHQTTRIEIPDGGRDLLLSPDGKYLSELDGACGDGGGGAHKLWDAETGNELSIWYPGGTCGPYNHVFSADGQLLIIGWDFDVAILDVATFVEEAASDDRHYLEVPRGEGGIFYYPGNHIEQVILSPDGSRLALTIAAVDQFGEGERDTRYRVDVFEFSDIIAHMENQTLLETAVIISDAQHVFFSPDSQWLLTDTGFWNAATGEQLAHVSGSVAAFSPDGSVLTTVTDSEVALWDVSALVQGSESPEVLLNVEEVRALAFSPDGTLLYIQRAGDVQVWGVAASIPG